MEAEAAAEDTKMILGWLWDFHRLLLSLPTNKFIAWSKGIKEMINQGTTHAKELEQNIGRFTNLGVAMPSVYHFIVYENCILTPTIDETSRSIRTVRKTFVS